MRTKAIILKKQATNEHDQLITCYTEEFGKITAVAKSVLKPGSIQAMHLDVFNLVDFELISGRGTPIIAGAQAEQTYPDLKNNLQCLSVAYFFAETADKLFFEYQKDEALWDFFVELLGELNHGHHGNDHGAHGFLRDKQIEFLNLLGYAPNLGECASCAVPIVGQMMAYSVEARGAICQQCFLGGMRGMIVKNNDILSSAFLATVFEGLIEKKLYSLNFIKSMLE